MTAYNKLTKNLQKLCDAVRFVVEMSKKTRANSTCVATHISFCLVPDNGGDS